MKTFPKAHADIVRLLNRNRIFLDRTKGIGVLTKEEAINRSCTGPVARASGVVRDLRKDEPYLAYPELQSAFKVVCATGGDCCARYLVRMEEMAESMKIIAAAVENLPGGPVNVDARRQADDPGQDGDVPQHRRADPALRAVHVEPAVGDAGGRGVRGERDGQRRTRLLRRGGRQRQGVPGADAAAVVHPLRHRSRT